MFLLSACTVWLLVRRDDDYWILLWSSRNHFSLPHHHGLSVLQYWMEKTFHVNYNEELLVLRLVPDGPGLTWMFSDAVLPQRFWLFYLRPWKMKFPLLCGVNTSFALSLLAWSSDASIFSNSFMSATIMSPFQIPPAKNPELMQSRLVFRRNRVTFDHCSKRYYWFVKGHSEPPFVRCFPIRQEILNVSQIAVAFHRIRPPFVTQTGLQ